MPCNNFRTHRNKTFFFDINQCIKTRPKQKAGIENMTLQTMIEDNLKSSILELMNSRTIVETPINAQIDNAQLKRISENRVIEQFLSANRPPYHAPKA